MTLPLSRAAGRRPAPRYDRGRAIARQLSLFHQDFRCQIVAVAARHPYLADLALSFPAVLFQLAVRRPSSKHEEIIAAVLRGEPLSRLAERAGLPLWTRKLPPEAFRGPVPRLPDSELFHRQIVNHLPRGRRHLWHWLNLVAFAGRWAGADFAVWCARCFCRNPMDCERFDWPLLTLWSWHSMHPETLAGTLVDVRWSPALGHEAAVAAAEIWLNRVDLCLALGPDHIREPLCQPSEVDGLSFVPLRRPEDVVAESQVMNNCMATYGPYLRHGHGELWSIRRGGAHVAALSVDRTPWEPLPRIGQLVGPGNDDVSREVWNAAAVWLTSHDLVRLCREAPEKRGVEISQRQWQSMWKPYWLDHQAFPRWLPLRPGEFWRRKLESIELPGHPTRRERRRKRPRLDVT